MKETYIANISGGKDSVAMCLRLVEENVPVDHFVFCDTGWEYPECYEAIERFEQITGRKVERLTRSDGEDFVFRAAHKVKRRPAKGRQVGYGFPNIFRRWCTNDLKIVPIKAFDRKFKNPIHLIGIAADEGKRIRSDPKRRYPLVEWNMTEADCLAYCRERGFFPNGKSPYDHIDRMSCFCCPLSNLKQVEYLVKHRPELWARIKWLEKEIGEPWKRGTEYYEKKYGENLQQDSKAPRL